MAAIFSNSFESLNITDLENLLGWPESLTVEFKRELNGREGRPDGWVKGGKVEAYAQTKLFKEIVALANTSGGHLFIGIDEDKGSPPLACAIKPVPRCCALAERLIQMAQSIDPPIPLLAAVGIPIEGDAGVVVVRIPASRDAPHRSIDREVYVRRGTNSLPITMREIRDMIGMAGRAMVMREGAFETAAVKFRDWLTEPFADDYSGKAAVKVGGFRITAAPTSDGFNLPRIYGRINEFVLKEQFVVRKSGLGPFRLDALWMPRLFRPIVRGVYGLHEYTNSKAYLQIFDSGLLTIACRMGPRGGNPDCQVYLSRIVPHMLNILHLANILRSDAGIPEQEYEIEVEISSRPGIQLRLSQWGVGFDDDLDIIPPQDLPLVFPRLSFGPVSDTNGVINAIATDFCDAGGLRWTASQELEVVS